MSGFLSPPNSAKPRVWWHWTNGNVTKEGITKDMEWMKRVGIGGMQLFDVGSGGGQNVDKKVVFMTPEWLEMVQHAASEADRLDLEMTIHSSAGWSLTGGPWVKPEQAMKKLVWIETHVEGSTKFKDKLPPPPFGNGPIRNRSNLRFAGFGEERNVPPDPTYYGDIVVLAYRTLEKEVRMTDLNPKVTSSSGVIDALPLLDDDLTTRMALSVPEDGKPAWVQFEFDQPFRARAFSISVEAGMRGIPPGLVQASDDGINYRTLVALPGAQHDRSPFSVRTYAFPETTARYYRVELKSYPTDLLFGRRRRYLKMRTPAPLKQYDITEMVFHSGARVNRWEDKAGFTLMFEYESVPTPMVPDAAIIQQNDVINLTSKLAKDGILEWNVPPGNWTILRLGYSLTGSRNGPAVPEGTGGTRLTN